MNLVMHGKSIRKGHDKMMLESNLNVDCDRARSLLRSGATIAQSAGTATLCGVVLQMMNFLKSAAQQYRSGASDSARQFIRIIRVHTMYRKPRMPSQCMWLQSPPAANIFHGGYSSFGASVTYYCFDPAETKCSIHFLPDSPHVAWSRRRSIIPSLKDSRSSAPEFRNIDRIQWSCNSERTSWLQCTSPTCDAMLSIPHICRLWHSSTCHHPPANPATSSSSITCSSASALTSTMFSKASLLIVALALLSTATPIARTQAFAFPCTSVAP
ncbi:hypothetical protein B0H21DRAFT_199421 [Amylocystis lapponica]|nr:hypothetical protein B0H21DRAFT_199421 [Amylocystis lapponica]